jgi:succinoglycan biosynthesis transport protein ExoP
MSQELQDTPVGIDLQHILGIVRRRHLHFLLPLFAGWLLVWGVSWVLPSRYRSGTLILVEQPTMPKDYVTPNINDDLQERLQSITQQILSRTRLLHIIDQFGLYRTSKQRVTRDDQVERMRKDIEIELVRDARNQVTAFNVYYTSNDPKLAQQVTNELTSLFINENLEVRQRQSEDTTKFLESQLESTRQSLSEQEEKMREFKAQHVGELPAQLATNLQILGGLQNQLQSEVDALNGAKQQHAYLQTLINQYRTMHATTGGQGTSAVGLPGIDQELTRLRAQLADLSSHYTDQHPDVRKVKEQIVKLEKSRDQLIAGMKTQSSTSADSTTADTASLDSPDSVALLQLQGQLRANQIEIDNREHSISELKAKISEYQGRLNQEPIREQQLADLTRGYDQSKASYDELLKKRNESAMATSMELLQQGERFRVLDPPSYPQKPDFPNRLKFCGIGLGVGLMLGCLVAGAFEMLDDRVYDEKLLTGILPVAVLCEVPEIITPEHDKNQQSREWLGWATAATVLIVILGGSAISYFRG